MKIASLSVASIACSLVLAQGALANVSLKQSGAKLTIQGDGENDAVAVHGASAFGEVLVSVNGSSPAPFFGVRDLEVALGDGDDQLGLHALQIGGSVKAKLGDGADVVTVTVDAVVDGSFLVARHGEFSLGGDFGDLFLVVDVSDFSVVFGGNLVVKGAADVLIDGNGGSSDSEPVDVFVGGDLRIESSFTFDVNQDGFTIDVDDVNVGGSARFTLGKFQDQVRITDSHFARDVELKLGDGDDDLVFSDDGTEFNAAVTVDGGGGEDSALEMSKLVIAQFPKFKNMELVEVLPAP